MKYYGYKLLLFILRVIMYIKRGLLFLWAPVQRSIVWVYGLWQRTVGFYVYKLFFAVKKYIMRHRIPLDGRFIDIIGRRSTLQVALFVVILAIMMPQSRLYSAQLDTVPGQQTLLYQLVGPGDQDYGEVEIVVEEAHFNTPLVDNAIWKDGTVGVGSPGTVGREITREAQDLSSISAGGSAITKPSILPGSELPEVVADAAPAAGRNQPIEYEVQSGDVIGSIAEKFGISVNTILWANDLNYRSYIRPGDRLTILPATGVLHTVVRGDTLLKIAGKYDAEADKIIAANRLQKDGSDLVIGEKLFIPDGQITITRPVVSTRPTSFAQISAPPPSVSAPAGSGYIWPTNVHRITQYFGWRHTGVDIAGPVGSPLYAARAGRVIKSQCGWNGGYGCYVIIDHGGGVNTLYGHASQLYVSAGESVAQGQTIALMGSTGNSTGPHIHFEVRVNGVRTNPLQYVR